jgi:hypothetical protein
VGAVVDYVLPQTPASPVVIEIVSPDGTGVRRFASDQVPPRPSADLYFNDRWLAPPVVPTARAGHNRLVWDLRYPAPRALEPEYSIAAVPGGAVASPAGALVLPGHYEVRLTVDGRTLSQPLTVVMDPRVETTLADLEALFAFERQVATELARSAELAETVRGTRERLRGARDGAASASARAEAERALAELDRIATSPDESPARVNGVLTSLAQDLESACAAPTSPQRQVLAQYREALDRFESGWADFAGAGAEHENAPTRRDPHAR